MNLKKKLKYWCRTNFKRITIVLLLAFTQFQMVYANTVAGGWSFTNPVSQGASTAWDATKNMGDKVTKGVASIKPTPSQVAKGILKGGLVGAALTATEQLLEDGVDFVLDPANNTIRFTKKTETGCTSDRFDCTNSQYLYNLDGSRKYFTLNQIKNNLQSIITWIDGVYYISHTEHFNFINVNLYRKDLDTIAGQTMYLSRNPAYQPKQETLPIEAVASKIIDNADENDKEAEDYVNAVAQDLLDSNAENATIEKIEEQSEANPNDNCPSGIIKNGSCWICGDKKSHYLTTRVTRDAKTATREKSCKNITDPAIKAINATFFKALINARIQENACWLPPDPNHIARILEDKNALSICEN